MEAIILAGGFGTRLQSVVSDVPKPMAPINGKPFLEYLLKTLSKQGFNKVVLAVGYKSDIIKNYFKNKFLNIELSYSNEDSPLGTGGCIKKALTMCSEDYVYIMNGDTFFDINYKEMKTSSDVMIACKKMYNFDRYGKVVINQDNRIINFEEKRFNDEGYINGGIYLIKRNIFDGYPLKEKFSLEIDFFTKYVNSLYIEAYKTSNYFIDIGIPEDYKKAQGDFNE